MQDLVGKKTRVLYYQWTENSISMFNSHEWPRQSSSIQFKYNINQISDEDKEK